MTNLLYLDDSYIKSFSSTISASHPDTNAVELDQTAFYPGGGGQPFDIGYLVSPDVKYTITKVKKVSGKYLHYLDDDNPLPEINTRVKGEIDWERRYKLMRTHTAMHILCGVIFRDYGATVTGGNMDPLKGRMDFEFETMRKELVTNIENSINVEVIKARKVSWQILPREMAFKIPDLIRTKINLLPEGITEVRVVEIDGLDLQADGGTHVKNTSEVGRIKVTNYKSKGKINKRIYIELSEL